MNAATGPDAGAAWWQRAVVYQLYVRSFADTNRDGVGDLEGIRQHLGHIASLGCEAIWLNPCYPSPQMDHGYDIADYFDIDPAYGTLADFDRLVGDAAAHGLKIVMDVVPNHCSTEHAWFRAAVAAGRGSPERERFWFRDGRGEHAEMPPNDWRAIFGGPAWTRVAEPDGTPGQWYLHSFTPWQPDFNWYHPEVIDYFHRMLTFWFDRGVEGFRIDATPVLGKDPALPDMPPFPDGLTDAQAWAHNTAAHFHPSAHEVWRGWRNVISNYERTHPGRQLYTVSEAYGTEEQLMPFLLGDQFHQSFAFDLMLMTWRAESVQRAIAASLDMLTKVGGHAAWTLNNHDSQRVVTRLGRASITDPAKNSRSNLVYDLTSPLDLDLGRRRARAAIAMTAALPGALYLYMGEELGLEEYIDMPDERREDPLFIRTGGAELGRDGCRVPMPWTTSPESSFGFSESGHGAIAAPWLPQPAHWGTESVEAEEHDPASMLAFYRDLLHHRRSLTGAPTWVDHDLDNCVVFDRDTTRVVVNLAGEARPLPDAWRGDVVLDTAAVPGGAAGGPWIVAPDSCRWISRS